MKKVIFPNASRKKPERRFTDYPEAFLFQLIPFG